ncbi:MAG: NFACT family protein [Butyrivibrio sp.]|nr:NFACT family protein [Butyrivibrio sp.]
MAFDGITVAAITGELQNTLTDGRINRIAQTEGDELLLTIARAPERGGGQVRLLLSADATLPLLYLYEGNKQAPMTAPNFCMLLRKHLQNGRIREIVQPGLERIVRFRIEHLNEMGDLTTKTLLIELMGKYSNIIFLDADEQTIIDAIKRVPSSVSSVREVLPGRTYFIPQTRENPLEATADSVCRMLGSVAGPLAKAIYGSFAGISPVVAQELCFRAGLDGDEPAISAGEDGLGRLAAEFVSLMQSVREGAFTPTLYRETDTGIVREYAAIPLTMYEKDAAITADHMESISALLSGYYARKNSQTRIRQKSADLRSLVRTALERTVRKLEQQRKQLADTQKRDRYRLYGDLLTTYGYDIPMGVKEAVLNDYTTGQEVRIPLDETLSAAQNGTRYYERYARQKRTAEAVEEQLTQTEEAVSHLESVAAALDIAQTEGDLAQIRQELMESGYIRNRVQQQTGRNGRKKGGSREPASKPLHYISSDGFDIYVGKNNTQNDQLTFREANGGDWWFHAKKIPGSHVVLMTGGREVPDRAFEEAAALAGYYSKGREQDKVEIDYLRRRDVKKPAGAKPGFVVYYTNFSMAIAPDISSLREVSATSSACSL